MFPDAGDHTAYDRDVVSAILDAADEVGATAIAYRSRDGNRLMRFLSGDLSAKLVTNATVPVIALPETTTASDRRSAGPGARSDRDRERTGEIHKDP